MRPKWPVDNVTNGALKEVDASLSCFADADHYEGVAVGGPVVRDLLLKGVGGGTEEMDHRSARKLSP